ncbi:MAG: class I SAM-dependent methyltransferase [Bacteroidales bacterium]|jgi:ubiquinone/menaquinone biosynthesis C-methylase UbiE|nr:class I SAM-dependent methyltransferase [Bacteroidales bacterium]
MKLPEPQKSIYSKERKSALEAQRLAQEIAFGPIVFQVSRLMVKFGIFQMLDENKKGLTFEEIKEKSKLSSYAVKVLLESSLTIGTILHKDEKFFISKSGWFLINDEMVKVNMDFNHDVNYLGTFNLEEALITGKPEGLKVFGNWSTIYEGLSQLPEQVQKSWFGFDHFYSDNSFEQALKIVFSNNPKTILDVGGNTGRWAVKCVQFSETINVTIMDLPQQLELMRVATKNIAGADRIHGYGTNLLDEANSFPIDFDAIWMSQFLDCFSEEQVTSILTRAAKSMSKKSRLFIMETFWDNQKFETASYCLAQISLYFTALANGNSKMYHSADMEKCVNNAGLKVEILHEGIGLGHSIMQCVLNDVSLQRS